MPFCAGRSGPIYYEVAGSGPPLVFIHANPFDHRMWMFQTARYAATHRTVAVDLRGYGRSTKPETAFSLADMADDVLRVCAAEEVKRAPIVGCSVGSGIALWLALETPQLVEALVLVGGNSRGGAGTQDRIDGYLGAMPGYQRGHLRELFAPGFDATPLGGWLVDLFSAQADALSGRCIAQIFRARGACDMTPRLGEIACPTIVVNGEHDASLASGRTTAAGIRGARHVVIAGTGHACPLEAPAAFERAVGAVLPEG